MNWFIYTQCLIRHTSTAMIDEKLCNTYILFVSLFYLLFCACCGLKWHSAMNQRNHPPPKKNRGKNKNKGRIDMKLQYHTAYFEQDLV